MAMDLDYLLFSPLMKDNTANFTETREMIIQDFGLDIPGEGMDEAALFQILADAVAYMIEHRIDFLMSLLYRLDVLEPHINHALSPLCLDPANIALAKLIMERQKQRVQTKMDYRKNIDRDQDMGDLAF